MKEEQPVIYWQVGDGPVHEIPDGSTVYILNPKTEKYKEYRAKAKAKKGK